MAAMEARLNKEVTRMRAQLMSFSNEGAEFSLNVPDTNEVKGTEQQLFVERIVSRLSLTFHYFFLL